MSDLWRRGYLIFPQRLIPSHHGNNQTLQCEIRIGKSFVLCLRGPEKAVIRRSLLWRKMLFAGFPKERIQKEHRLPRSVTILVVFITCLTFGAYVRDLAEIEREISVLFDCDYGDRS